MLTQDVFIARIDSNSFTNGVHNSTFFKVLKAILENAIANQLKQLYDKQKNVDRDISKSTQTHTFV